MNPDSRCVLPTSQCRLNSLSCQSSDNTFGGVAELWDVLCIVKSLEESLIVKIADFAWGPPFKVFDVRYPSF